MATNTVQAKVAKSLDKKKKQIRLGGGQLATTNEAELQQLSADKGLQASPITPVGAAATGASPDSVKMAGTGQQKAAALQTTTDTSSVLSDVQRRRQARTDATADEAALLEKKKKYEQLGGVADSVENLVQSYMAVPAEGAAPEVTTTVQGAEGLSEDQQGWLAELSNPGPDTNINELRAKLVNSGVSDPDSYLQQKGVEGSIQDASTVTLANMTDLTETVGMDVNELSGLLGLSPEETGALTPETLEAKINQLQAEEYAELDRLQGIISDPGSSPAEKAEARRLLRDKGATGITTAESEIDNIEAEIREGKMISFGGEEIAVEDLLSDEHISDLAEEYQAGTPEQQEAFRKKYGDDFPDLIDAHAEAFKEAATIREEQKEEFQTIQDTKESVLNNTNLDPETLGNIFGGEWDKALSELPDYDSIPFMKVLMDKKWQKNNPEEWSNLQSNIKNAASLNPEIAKELAGLSHDELRSLGAFKSPKGNNKMGSYLRWKRAQDFLENANPNDPKDMEEVWQIAAGPDLKGRTSPQKVLDMLYTQGQLQGPELKDARMWLDVFDKNRDGKPDAPTSIMERMKQVTAQRGTPKAIIASKDRSPGIVETRGRGYKELVGILKDNKVSPKEWDRAGVDQLEFLGRHSNPKIRAEAKKRLGAFRSKNNQAIYERYGKDVWKTLSQDSSTKTDYTRSSKQKATWNLKEIEGYLKTPGLDKVNRQKAETIAKKLREGIKAGILKPNDTYTMKTPAGRPNIYDKKTTVSKPFGGMDTKKAIKLVNNLERDLKAALQSEKNGVSKYNNKEIKQKLKEIAKARAALDKYIKRKR